jgi:hypothetical protein
MRRCFAGAIRGINAVQHLGALTEDQYLSIRLDDVAGHLFVVIIEMCGAEPLADDAWQSPAVLACLESAGMVGGLDNDLFSYRKESVHDLNLINVLQGTRGLSLQTASCSCSCNSGKISWSPPQGRCATCWSNWVRLCAVTWSGG